VGFNYDKHKSAEGHGSVWTAYSDLFLGLSIIFLLLYVTVSLRQGTDGIQQFFENQKLVHENEDLKQQLKTYETLKQDYLNKSASKQEADSYEELMDQLDLLQDKAQEEKVALEQQAAEHEKKERALNKYQQMIRNIINSNLVAKGRIKTRDQVIENQDEKIATDQEEIKDLEQAVAEKRAQLALGEKKVKDLNENLSKRMKQLRESYKAHRISLSNFEKQKKAMEADAQGKVAELKQKNQQVATALANMNRQLAQTTEQLEETNQKLGQTTAQLGQTSEKLGQTTQQLGQTKEQLNATNQKLGQTAAQLGQASQQLGQAKEKLNETNSKLAAAQKDLGALNAERNALQGQIGKLKADYEAQRGKEKAAFDAALAREKLSGKQRAAREAAFKADADRKAKAMQDQLAKLSGDMKETQDALARAQENLNARKKITDQIKKNFAAAGIKADVDAKTGDVVLSFGDQYFDTDRADLKPGMVNIIRQAVPTYSKSLFQDPKIASRISNVEIVGFASPTYKGKYIDPNSLDPSDRQAVNYNLDLSYARAKAIFSVVFDKNQMTFEHQKQLLPLVKVTGRSFLANPQDARGVANESHKSFCEKNDCAKLQRVIIKFNLKD
jgi:ABC-type transporter Mla subunit MlaD